MFFKKLTLSGFKSFCDKTELEFDAGITCVVGPNGCGKSNVVDAIKWVVGEQSPKSLRGRQMLDMIFNGSSTRKSSGMCQVDLHFDNSEKRLPSEHDEVTVSRRLYRSGESEYLINNEVVRLKDVRELFMDTGIGVGAYSIIEQGRVDVLLQANPLERRTIFEEAAGISRFKARRTEAVRKLERAEQNLLRVQDIVDEVERRLRSIKVQAGKARNYQEYSRRMRELQAGYSLAEYHRLTQRLTECAGCIDSTHDRISEQRATLTSSEARTGRLDAQIVELDETITATEHRLHGVRAEMTACTERAAQTRRRLAEQTDVLRAAGQRVEAQQKHVEHARADIAEHEAEAGRVATLLAGQQDRLDDLTRRDQAAASGQADNQAATDEVRARIIELMRAAAHVNNEIAGLQQHRRSLDERAREVSERRGKVAQQISELQARQDERGQDLVRLTEKLAGHNGDLSRNQTRSEALDAERSELSGRLAECKERRSALESRRQLLLDLDCKMEGIESGVREILRQRDEGGNGEFAYVRGLIGELFEADVTQASIVEAALGDLDQSLLVTDSEALLADADRLALLPGRVNTLCLDRIPPVVNGPDLSGQDGFVAGLLELVRYPEELEVLAKHLLGRTVLVETVAHAVAMRHLSPASRFITRRGEVLEADGRVSLGAGGTRAGLVSRKSELRHLAGQIDELDQTLAGLSEQLSRASAEFAALSKAQQEIRAAIFDTQHARIQAEAELGSVLAAIERLRQEVPLLEGEADSIRAQLAHIDSRRREHDGRLATLETETAEAQERAESLRGEADALKEQRLNLGEELTRQRVEAGQLSEKRRSLADRINALRVSLGQAEVALDEARVEVASCRERIEEGERTLAECDAAMGTLAQDEQRLSAETLGHRRQREAARAEVEELGGQIKSIRGELEQTENELHELKLQNQECALRREELVARVRDELAMDLSGMYARYEHNEQDWAAVEAEIADLRKKIERLGNVNLDAIAEQEELEKRAGFLVSQRNDLVESQRQLQELIGRLDAECRDRFTATFETARGHFQSLFRRLFGGGKANIVLEDPEDILESGIEIIAQPPGKELLRISLMSGGEKSMTAIAMLLAIFKCRPSPFAVLDEVDAALDEANNERFNRIVNEFLSDSQFIIITHSKRTMSIADKLYGVTMQEAGVSTLVSVRFEDETRSGQAVA